MTPEQKQLHADALASGYRDETCAKCGTEFLAHIHFIRCDSRPCPMISNEKSLLQRLIDENPSNGKPAT